MVSDKSKVTKLCLYNKEGRALFKLIVAGCRLQVQALTCNLNMDVWLYDCMVVWLWLSDPLTCEGLLINPTAGCE